MNILVLNWRDIRHPEAGGAEVHFHELFERLVARGHTVYLLTTRYPGSTPLEEINGVTVYRWGHTLTFNWEAPVFIRYLKKRHRFDVIIDDVNKIPFFTPKWYPSENCGVFFHHLFGRTVFELAAPPLAAYVLLLEKLSPWGYRGVPCCTVSKSTADELVHHGFERHNITVIENSVDTDIYKPAHSIKKDENLILYAGRLKRYKNVSALLTAVKMLRDSNLPVRLAIAGSGDDESRLRAQAGELGLSEHVRFVGFVDRGAQVDLYRRASVYVNPSYKEGWGITNIEANACGTAVVANDAPGLRDSVINDKTGLLYKTNNVESMADAIRTLITTPRKRKMLEKGGREWAQTFSWAGSADKVEKWLKQIPGVNAR